MFCVFRLPWRLIPLMLAIASPAAAQSPFYDFGFIGAGVSAESSAFSTHSTEMSLKPSIFYNGRYGFIG